LGTGKRAVRVMPNTPALVGASATAYALGKHAQAGDGELVEKLFSAVGSAHHVREYLLDEVPGLSGSGPACVYMFIEGLRAGDVASARLVKAERCACLLLRRARCV